MKIKINRLVAEDLRDELMNRYTEIFDQLDGCAEGQKSNDSYVFIDRLKLLGDVEAMNSVLRQIKQLKSL